MSGGSVEEWVRALDSSKLTITGGTVGDRLQALDFSTIVMSGGTVGTTIDADDSATIEIIGRHFKVDWSPVPYGDLTALTGELSGVLASGEHLVNEFHQGGGAFTGTIRLIESARLPALSPWSQLVLVTGLMGAGMGVWRKRVV
jgi:hypothetical protein